MEEKAERKGQQAHGTDSFMNEAQTGQDNEVGPEDYTVHQRQEASVSQDREREIETLA